MRYDVGYTFQIARNVFNLFVCSCVVAKYTSRRCYSMGKWPRGGLKCSHPLQYLVKRPACYGSDEIYDISAAAEPSDIIAS